MTENDGGRVGVPGDAQVPIGAAGIGDQDPRPRHLHHKSKYAPPGADMQRALTLGP